MFVWSVVLSRFGDGRPAFEQARQWYHRLAGTEFWSRPFQMRLFERTFDGAVQTWRGKTRSRHPLAKRFPDVAVVDSTVLQVSDELRTIFKGTRSAVASLMATDDRAHSPRSEARARRPALLLRWQVELVFKELKQHLNLEALSSRQPGRARVALPARADEPCASWNHPAAGARHRRNRS